MLEAASNNNYGLLMCPKDYKITITKNEWGAEQIALLVKSLYHNSVIADDDIIDEGFEFCSLGTIQCPKLTNNFKSVCAKLQQQGCDGLQIDLKKHNNTFEFRLEAGI